MSGGGSLSHFKNIYLPYESPPAVEKISLFQSFCILIIIRQKICKILFLKQKALQQRPKGLECQAPRTGRL